MVSGGLQSKHGFVLDDTASSFSEDPLPLRHFHCVTAHVVPLNSSLHYSPVVPNYIFSPPQDVMIGQGVMVLNSETGDSG